MVTLYSHHIVIPIATFFFLKNKFSPLNDGPNTFLFKNFVSITYSDIGLLNI